MAWISGRRVLFTSVIFIVLAYYLHVPLPKNIADRGRLQIFETIMRISYFYPLKLFKNIGSPEWQVYWTRRSFQIFSMIFNPWSRHDTHLNMHDTHFDGVPVRVYVPKDSRASDGAIVYFHGGGFVIMDVESYDGFMRELARQAKMIVISVEYRLAPEHKFPAGIEDCEKAVKHLFNVAYKELNINRDRVAIMGDSAGGNLAAVVSQRMRNYEHQPKMQVLLYPVMQYVDLLTPSYQLFYSQYGQSALLDPESIARWLMMYVGVDPHPERIEQVLQNNHTTWDSRQLEHWDHVRHDHLPQEFHHDDYVHPPTNHGNHEIYKLLEPFLFNPDFSPLMHPDLSGLPKALVVTCEYDILRDEGFWYARRLKEHGVDVHHKHYDQGFHAMLSFFTEIALAKDAIKEIADYTVQGLNSHV